MRMTAGIPSCAASVTDKRSAYGEILLMAKLYRNLYRLQVLISYLRIAIIDSAERLFFLVASRAGSRGNSLGDFALHAVDCFCRSRLPCRRTSLSQLDLNSG